MIPSRPGGNFEAMKTEISMVRFPGASNYPPSYSLDKREFISVLGQLYHNSFIYGNVIGDSLQVLKKEDKDLSILVSDLNCTTNAVVMPDSPDALCMGEMCLDEGWGFHWFNGVPRLTTLEGKGILRSGTEENLLASEYSAHDELNAEFKRTFRHSLLFWLLLCTTI